MVDLLIVHPILNFFLGIDGDFSVPVTFRTGCLVQSDTPVQAMTAKQPTFASASRALNIDDHISSPGCHVLSDVRG